MDWSKGFSSRYVAYEVDPMTWRDISQIEIIGGSITKSTDALMQSADLECQNYDGSSEKWIRIYLEARQTGDAYYGALFTGLASSPNINIEGNVRSTPVQLYSVLKPADDILLPKGWYAANNADGIDIVESLLNVTPAPIVIEGAGQRLTDTIVAEDGETNLTMATSILNTMNWEIKIDGDGTIHLRPAIALENLDKVITFDSIENDCLETSVSIENDWFNCPNVFRATYGDIVAIVRDEDANSRFSIPSRGREVWAEENDCDLSSGETIDDYAKRMLESLQQTSYEISYSRRFNPDVDILDIIRLNYPAQDILGYYQIESQSISLGHNATVSETASKIV